MVDNFSVAQRNLSFKATIFPDAIQLALQTSRVAELLRMHHVHGRFSSVRPGDGAKTPEPKQVMKRERAILDLTVPHMKQTQHSSFRLVAGRNDRICLHLGRILRAGHVATSS